MIAAASERAILAACLTTPEACAEICGSLSPADFGLDSHRQIFGAVIDSANSGDVDLITVTNELAKRNKLQSVGGSAFVSTLTDGAVISNISRHIEVLRDHSRRRQLAATCQSVLTRLEDKAETTQDAISSLSEALLAIESDAAKTTAVPMKQAVSEAMDALQVRAKRDGLLGLPTGISGLDEATTGIRPGELWVVGALPGRGKTSIGEQIALATAAAGFPTIVFSHEMTREELAIRALATQCLSASTLRDPRYIRDADWQVLWDSAGRLADLPLWIDDTPSLKTHELISRARLYVRRHKTNLIIVDYLQLVNGSGRDRKEQVASVAAALRVLAKSEKVGVVLLSQLSRPDGGLNSRPNMLQLKESGDIEAHAHTVCLLYMPVDEQGKFLGEDELIVGKQRHGKIGSIPVHYNGKKLQFEDRT